MQSVFKWAVFLRIWMTQKLAFTFGLWSCEAIYCQTALSYLSYCQTQMTLIRGLHTAQVDTKMTVLTWICFLQCVFIKVWVSGSCQTLISLLMFWVMGESKRIVKVPVKKVTKLYKTRKRHKQRSKELRMPSLRRLPPPATSEWKILFSPCVSEKLHENVSYEMSYTNKIPYLLVWSANKILFHYLKK